MRTLPSEPTARSTPSLTLVAREPESPWAARGLTDLVPPATLIEARLRRDELATLLGHERAAAADFLLALSDFDRRRGWERLGHASLFAFLTREFGLSAGAAQLRLSAARLLPRHPAVEAALRSGRLCISAVGQLARVLTAANEGAVLPRFFGRSAREAADLAAELLPRADSPRREVVTVLQPKVTTAAKDSAVAPSVAAAAAPTAVAQDPAPAALVLAAPCAGLLACPAPDSPAPLHTYEVPGPHPGRPRTPAVEPLTADLRRLHLTVTAGFLEKVAAARTGLSHALPGATTEQVLEAALDQLLERLAQRKGLVKRPRATRNSTLPSAGPCDDPLAKRRDATSAASTPCSPTMLRPGRPRPPKGGEAAPTSARPHLPAHVEREVRLRDGDRCQYPLDAGGVCGSTWQVELDHVIPASLGGPTTFANLRCACRVHNQAAAREALGEAAMVARRLRRPR